jgi:hypothetical protein
VSGGDVWVLDHAERRARGGDFVTLPVPFLDTCTTKWSAAMGRLEALPFDRVLPGHGRSWTATTSSATVRRWIDCWVAPPVNAAWPTAAGWIADLGSLLPAASRRAWPRCDHYFQQRLRARPSSGSACKF